MYEYVEVGLAPIIQHETKAHPEKVRSPLICKFCHEDMGGNVVFLCRHIRVFHSRTGNEFICNQIGCEFQAPEYEKLISHCKVLSLKQHYLFSLIIGSLLCFRQV